jgi:hypothetical protein
VAGPGASLPDGRDEEKEVDSIFRNIRGGPIVAGWGDYLPELETAETLNPFTRAR